MMGSRCYAFTAFAAISTISQLSLLKRKILTTPRYPLVSSLLVQSVATCSANKLSPEISFLDSKTAKDIDVSLMSNPGFSIDQLMELAGLSVASAINDFVNKEYQGKNKILVVCGPGNNGGDGLVAARHLSHFGYLPTIVYYKGGKDIIFTNLIQQCNDLNIPILKELPKDLSSYDIVVDAIFGFSFQGPSKSPYSDMISQMASTSLPVISVDIPSGWHVDNGDMYDTGFEPSCVVSLTAPKLCMKSYKGAHYLGGRFIPPSISKQYNLNIPSYGVKDSSQFIRLDQNRNVESVSSLSSPLSLSTTVTGIPSTTKLYMTPEGYPYFYNEVTGDSEWLRFEQQKDQLQQQYITSGSSSTSGDVKKIEKATEDNVVMMISTTSSMQEAQAIAGILLDGEKVACVNIIPGVTSVYRWQGKINTDVECILLIKTRRSLIEEVTGLITSHHSYQVPEVVVLDTMQGKGNIDYLTWVLDSAKKNVAVTSDSSGSVSK